jgi:hypothetical protein
MVAYAVAADVVRCCCSMEEVWAANNNFICALRGYLEGARKYPG